MKNLLPEGLEPFEKNFDYKEKCVKVKNERTVKKTEIKIKISLENLTSIIYTTTFILQLWY